MSEFAKKTGDFKSLSAVDLRILGLTYQLEKEFCDAGHIKNEPYKKVCLSNLCLCERERERERESHLEEFSKSVDIISFLYARKQSPE